MTGIDIRIILTMPFCAVYGSCLTAIEIRISPNNAQTNRHIAPIRKIAPENRIAGAASDEGHRKTFYWRKALFGKPFLGRSLINGEINQLTAVDCKASAIALQCNNCSITSTSLYMFIVRKKKQFECISTMRFIVLKEQKNFESKI